MSRRFCSFNILKRYHSFLESSWRGLTNCLVIISLCHWRQTSRGAQSLIVLWFLSNGCRLILCIRLHFRFLIIVIGLGFRFPLRFPLYRTQLISPYQHRTEKNDSALIRFHRMLRIPRGTLRHGESLSRKVERWTRCFLHSYVFDSLVSLLFSQEAIVHLAELENDWHSSWPLSGGIWRICSAKWKMI